jgi:hypothetical protein
MAILTAANLRTAKYLPGISGSDLDTDVLAPLIEAADQALATYCGFPLPSGATERTLASSSYVLYVDSPGGRRLRLPVRPVTAIASIYDDPEWTWGSDALVASNDYALLADGGGGALVQLTASAAWGSWTKAQGAIKATVTAGYATGSSCPDFIRHAMGLLVGHYWRKVIPEVGARPNERASALLAVELPAEVKVAIHPAVMFGKVAG